jgi:hypothetical protein
MGNVSLTVAIPEKLKRELSELTGINWSEETRQFLEERVNRLKLLRRLDKLTKNSELTGDDVIRIGREINAGIARHHGMKVGK